MKQVYFFAIILCCLGCSNPDDTTPFCSNYRPGTILVGVKGTVNLPDAFALFNANQLSVKALYFASYTSQLPNDSIQYIIDYLNSKDYINHDGSKALNQFGSVWVGDDNLLYLDITLFDLSFANQADWIETASKLKLVEGLKGKYFRLGVDSGSEKIYVREYSKSPLIEYAVLDCVFVTID